MRFEVEGSDQHGERTATATGTDVPTAAVGLPNGVHHLGFYSNWQPKTGSQNFKTLGIDLGVADPAKKMAFVIAARNDHSPTFSIIKDGTEYPLTKTTGTNPSGTGGVLYLAEGDIPVGGPATLKATYTANTSGVYLFAARAMALKNVARVAAPSVARHSAVVGTPIGGNFATQPGDVAIMALLSIPTDPAGIVSASSIVTEMTDALVLETPDPGLHFWFGAGVDTVGGASRAINATPSVAGNMSRMNFLYRSV